MSPEPMRMGDWCQLCMEMPGITYYNGHFVCQDCGDAAVERATSNLRRNR